MGVGLDIIDKFILFWGCGVILSMLGNVYIEYIYCCVLILGDIIFGLERLVCDFVMLFVVKMCGFIMCVFCVELL